MGEGVFREIPSVIDVTVPENVWKKFEDKKLFYIHPACWAKIFVSGDSGYGLNAASAMREISLAKESIKKKSKLDLGLSAVKEILNFNPVAYGKASQFIRLLSHRFDLGWDPSECIYKCLFYIPDLEAKLKDAGLTIADVAQATNLSVSAVKTLIKYRAPIEIVRVVAEVISGEFDPDSLISSSLPRASNNLDRGEAYAAIELRPNDMPQPPEYIFDMSDFTALPRKCTPWTRK